ncbi:YbaN family protein [Oleiphilus messinensis]|uniref:YbaN family protein n=1 Tax=Oleiphilus messinensis TaxID=141451 RepID=UPI001E47FECF|nr:YbaN family protein [Oleiphilus messinensis]
MSIQTLNPLVRLLLISTGWLAVVLGVLGIFLPLLPTTPFILLAAGCFARSSERFHHWLVSHPNLGPIVKTWESGDGISIEVRNRIILVMWAGMAISMIIVAKFWATLFLCTTGVCVSIYLFRKTNPQI